MPEPSQEPGATRPPHRAAGPDFALPEPAAASPPRAIAWALGLLVIASVALCGWYASFQPHGGRYWDERFSVDNARTILATGSLKPANGYYQSLSYLPQTALLGTSQALHRWTGAASLRAYDVNHRFTATGYLLSRWLDVLYGAACLVLTYAIGRRVFSPAAGLLGAFLFAATPWHVQASSMFKPDVLLVLAVLATVYWSLGAAARPTLPRFALAGCGVALALSTKLTGGVVAVVPALAALLAGGTAGRRLLRLAAAGASGAVGFALLNPFFFTYGRFLDRNLDHYTRKAAAYGGTHLGVLRSELGFLLGEGTHGPLIGALALVAAVALAVAAVRARAAGAGTGGARTRIALLLAFPIVYSLAYAAATRHFKGNNFVVVLPFSSLLAAWALTRLWSLARERLPLLRRRFAWALPAAVLVIALAPAPGRHVYAEVVPPTLEQARAFLARRAGDGAAGAGSRVYAERGTRPASGPPRRPFDWPGMAVEAVERLDEVPEPALDRAAGLVFPAARLDGEGSAFYWRRIAGADPADVLRCTPGWLRARGPELLAIANPRPQSEPPASWRRNTP